LRRAWLSVWCVAGLIVGRPCGVIGQEAPPAGKVALEDEPDWNAGERLAATGQWDGATDAYLKVLRTTQKAWLRPRVAGKTRRSRREGRAV
jgi:hypothetical protein